ncbi:MAG TPA: hypothetical protein VGL38_05795 [bacterium]
MIRLCCIVLLCTALLLGGCGLFSTRPAETPDTGRHTWTTPVNPQDVLTNMRSALFEHDQNNYLLSFDPDHFQFVADPVTVASFPAMGHWDYEAESHHATQLFNPGTLPADSIIIVVFSSLVTPQPLGDSAEVIARYDLTAGVALTNVPHHVTGTADFWFRKGRANYWQIYRWQDTRTQDAATWSDFKSQLP